MGMQYIFCVVEIKSYKTIKQSNNLKIKKLKVNSSNFNHKRYIACPCNTIGISIEASYFHMIWVSFMLFT